MEWQKVTTQSIKLNLSSTAPAETQEHSGTKILIGLALLALAVYWASRH